MNNEKQMSRKELLEVIDILTKKNIKITEQNILLKQELRKWKPRPIEQYTIDGKYIQTFDTTSKAAKAMYGFPSNIRKALSGELKTAYGYKWRYAKSAIV